MYVGGGMRGVHAPCGSKAKTVKSACFLAIFYLISSFSTLVAWNPAYTSEHAATIRVDHMVEFCFSDAWSTNLFFEWNNGVFARRGTHLYAHNFEPLPGFLFVWRGIVKNSKTCCYFWFTLWQDFKFQLSVCFYIFVRCGCNLILWCELNKM